MAHAFTDLAAPANRTPFTMARQRLNQRTQSYAPALALAEWLLLGGGPVSAAGRGGSVGWWLDMPALFEAVVTRLVRRRAHGRGLCVRPQHRDRHAIKDGRGGCYRETRPDLEILSGDRVCPIDDAKYKRYGLATTDRGPVRKISPEDLYQLAFYGQAARDDVELYIAVPVDGAGPTLGDAYRSIRVAGRPLHLLGVDLSALVRGDEGAALAVAGPDVPLPWSSPFALACPNVN